MSVKTILAYLPNAAAAAHVLPAATELARRDGAHLIGLHITETAPLIYGGVTAFGAMPVFAEFDEAQKTQAALTKAAFDAAIAGEDFVAEWREAAADGQSISDRLIDHARAADIIIAPQAEPDAAGPDLGLILQRLIRKSGRPVLVIPYAGKVTTIATHALIGWSPTREAARAAHDAMSLLNAGASATILTAHHKNDAARLQLDTSRELAATYARHNIKTDIVDRTDDGIAIGAVLLNEAFERGADLIVTGAFGHSRVYDFVIGATTTYLLESMTVPVLFST